MSHMFFCKENVCSALFCSVPFWETFRFFAYRIPKRLEDDHPRRGREVESQAAALEAAQEDPRVPVVAQPVEAGLTVVILHAAVITCILEPFVIEKGLDNVEHGRELREDDELVLLHLLV